MTDKAAKNSKAWSVAAGIIMYNAAGEDAQCPKCRGTGKLAVSPGGFLHAPGIGDIADVVCGVCDGSGKAKT
jgi:DnaJ-class molecular chaperone